MEGIHVGMSKPKTYSPAKMGSSLQIDKRQPCRKNSPGLCLKNEGIGGCFRGGKKPNQVGIELTGRLQVAYLHRDET